MTPPPDSAPAYPTLTEIRDTIAPSRASLRVACGVHTAIAYAGRFGCRVADARRHMDAAVARGELTRDVFGVYQIRQTRRSA